MGELKQGIFPRLFVADARVSRVTGSSRMGFEGWREFSSRRLVGGEEILQRGPGCPQSQGR